MVPRESKRSVLRQSGPRLIVEGTAIKKGLNFIKMEGTVFIKFITNDYERASVLTLIVIHIIIDRRFVK